MRRILSLAAISLITFALVACGSSQSHQPGGERLKAAKAALDATNAFKFTLSTGDLPDGVPGVISATGFGTRQPGFQGTIKVRIGGFPAEVPVVALSNTVWAQILGQWQAIKPSQYGAPNPSDLMSTSNGISSLLTAVTGIDNGKQTRDGNTIVTTYAGTVSGAAVSKIVPISSTTSTFQMTFSLTDDNHLTKATITGPFFDKKPNVTYVLTTSPCDDCGTITAPK